MRSIWSGVISFGLINIPIKLYSATAGVSLDLNYLHKVDNSPIRYAKVCRKDGKELSMDDLVKGYEYQDGDYVVLTDEDFKKANLNRTQAIDILDFVKESEIDTVYYEKPYFLEPDKGSAKAYKILRESLVKTRKVGVAKFVLHNREHLGLVKPHGMYLVLEQMRFEDELKAPDKLSLPKHDTIRAKEISMAISLIDHLTDHFKPDQYHDTYREELNAIIKAKIKGHTPKAKGETPHPTKSTDLMEMLKESLEKAKNNPQMLHA